MQVAFVHHTVSANDYTAAEVPSIILSICRYHRNSNGWNDIGYNFLVDKFGTIWEGRAGGIDQAVVGAQAQGYNSHIDRASPTSARTQDVPADRRPRSTRSRALIRWKLPLHGAPTQGTVTLTSGGGSLNRYKAGHAGDARPRSRATATATDTRARATRSTRSCPTCARASGNVQPTRRRRRARGWT